MHGSVPIGRPIHHTRVYVLDEQRKPVGIGRKGELYAVGTEWPWATGGART